MNQPVRAYRAAVLHFLDDPDVVGDDASYQFFDDGILLVEAGKVTALGASEVMLQTLPADVSVVDYRGKMLCPGFVDAHTHYPQTEMIAAYGEQLLSWLERYTFPTEQQFSDPEYAGYIARIFLEQLLRCGTTTAQVFATVHPQSVDAFFSLADSYNLRMICGKVMMDRNAPDGLTDCAENSYQDSKRLIEKWHRRGRLRYAVTPRFAPTSSREQLNMAGRLLIDYPDVHLQTHLAENLSEVAWVRELFPESKHYLDVYDQAGLLGPRSTFAHCVHMQDDEWHRLAETDSAVAFCPSSNSFLGSGLFKLRRAIAENVKVGLGTDIGAGTSFSMLQCMADAYKTQHLGGDSVNAFKAFYLATLGGAKSLDCDKHIGNFAVGKEADFVVIDFAATPFGAFRDAQCKSLHDRLFALMLLGDDRAIYATYVLGECVHQRDTL